MRKIGKGNNRVSVSFKMKKTKVSIAIVLAILFLDCFSQLTNEKQEFPAYFPQIEASSFESKEVLDSFLCKWYSKQLFALKEPILFTDQDRNKVVYRLTVLRTFANPYSIRVENADNEIILYWKECDGSGGYEPGSLIKDKEVKLSVKDWKEINKYIDEIEFWDLPTEDNSNDSPPDGTTGIIEGLKNGEYHIVTHWNPENVDISKLFQFLIEKTDIDYKRKRD